MGASQCGKCGEDGKLTALPDDLQKDEAMPQVNDDALRFRSGNTSAGGGSTSSLTGQRPSHPTGAMATVATTLCSSGFGSGSSFGGSSVPGSARSMGGGRGLASSLSPRRPTQQALPSSARMALQEPGVFRRAISVDAVTARRQGFGSQSPCSSERGRGSGRKEDGHSSSADGNGTGSSAADRFRHGGRAVTAGVRLHKLLGTSRADVPPVKCAVSVEKLNAFEEQAKKVMGDAYPTATVRDIISAIIQPSCDGAGKAYARTLNDDQPCTGQVFVCHCWDQTFAELVEGVNSAFQHWPMKPNLWIAIFALVQTRRRTPCTRPSDAPFAAALSKARGILVLQSKQVDVYSRLWTLWEMYLASKFGILDKKGGLILAGEPSERGGGGGGNKPIDSQAALTSDPEDRRSIADAICAEDKAYDGVNAVATLIRDSHR